MHRQRRDARSRRSVLVVAVAVACAAFPGMNWMNSRCCAFHLGVRRRSPSAAATAAAAQRRWRRVASPDSMAAQRRWLPVGRRRGAPVAVAIREDLDGMLSAMGLTPAVKVSPASKRKPKKNNSAPKPSKSEQKKIRTVAKRRTRTKERAFLVAEGEHDHLPSPVTKTNRSRRRKPVTATTLAKKRTGYQGEERYDIDLKTQLDYARNGHAVVKNFLDPGRLLRIRERLLSVAQEKELDAWRQKVSVAASSSSDKPLGRKPSPLCRTIEDCKDRLERLGITAELPFLQYFNNWRSVEPVWDLAYDLGQMASVFMDVPTVRLYQDSLFWKRRGDGPTPWHVDARMAPFDTQHMVTFWIPLDKVTKLGGAADGGTGLLFCSKSHSDFALPYWNHPIKETSTPSPASEWDGLEHRYPKRIINYMPLDVGDATVHSGWTLHSSNGNENGDADRLALAITYVDGKAEIRPDALSAGDNEDRWSYQDWIHDVPTRKPFRHDLLPIVWPGNSMTTKKKRKKRAE